MENNENSMKINEIYWNSIDFHSFWNHGCEARLMKKPDDRANLRKPYHDVSKSYEAMLWSCWCLTASRTARSHPKNLWRPCHAAGSRGHYIRLWFPFKTTQAYIVMFLFNEPIATEKYAVGLVDALLRASRSPGAARRLCGKSML